MKIPLYIVFILIAVASFGQTKQPARPITHHKLKNIGAYLRLPSRASLDKKFLVPIDKDDSLLLQNFSLPDGKNTMLDKGVSWVIKAKEKTYNGYFEYIHKWKEIVSKDSNNGANEEWGEDKILLNDTLRKNLSKYRSIIFPWSIYTLAVSPDGNYIALLVGQDEANPLIDIIDTRELIRTGDYIILKEIDLSSGSSQENLEWSGNKLLIEANIDLTILNRKKQFSNDEAISHDSYIKYDYDVVKKVFEIAK